MSPGIKESWLFQKLMSLTSSLARLFISEKLQLIASGLVGEIIIMEYLLYTYYYRIV